MNAREFFMMTAKMRRAQKEYEKLPSTRNKTFKSQYEDIIDREIERVEARLKQEAEQAQGKLL